MPEDTVEAHIADTIRMLKKAGGLHEATVVLVGSAARGTQTWRSDTDLLVVTPKPIPRWRVPVDLHLHMETHDQFLEHLRHGEAFRAWALRFGKVVSDPSGWWGEVEAGVESSKWPSWRLKLDHVRKKRLPIASRLLEDGDEEAAQEEYLAIASQVARALLLRENVFPLSRPEIPSQLRQVGRHQLADAIEMLVRRSTDLGELETIAKCIERELGWLEEEGRTAAGSGR